jgi:uncharacterized protein YutE (UPF0331/DUF86 family)
MLEQKKKDNIFRLIDKTAELEKEEMAQILKEAMPYAEEFSTYLNAYVSEKETGI